MSMKMALVQRIVAREFGLSEEEVGVVLGYNATLIILPMSCWSGIQGPAASPEKQRQVEAALRSEVEGSYIDFGVVRFL